MEFLAKYQTKGDSFDPDALVNDDSVEEEPASAEKSANSTTVTGPILLRKKVDVAPVVASLESQVQYYHAPGDKEVFYNAPVEALFAPVLGPSKNARDTPEMEKNCWTGFVQEEFLDEYTFHAQYHEFHNKGQTRDPSLGNLKGTPGILQSSTILEQKGEGSQKQPEKKRKRKRSELDDPSKDTYEGPWKTPESIANMKLAVADPEMVENAKKRAEEKVKKNAAPEDFEETTTFHGTELYDYKGRSYVKMPNDLSSKVDKDHDCFLPKKPIHTWSGHTKGVAAIEFFPKSGHILLSAGMDSKLKIWDVYNKRQCLRTIDGHAAAVRSTNFSNDGTKFLSASYDKFVKYWDTETGKCLGKFTNKKIPFDVKFYPVNNNEFLAACANKKIVQWDIRANEIVQEYDRHLMSVNTVLFVDEGRRFISTSDDKSIRIWEYGIPVDFKLIQEPHMHSMPAVALHPKGKYFAAQSLDNQVLIYGAQNRFGLNKKKRFAGHLTAGYACQVAFSPDCSYVMSGSSQGLAYIWDWRTCRIIKKLKAHSGVCIGCIWHPVEPSRVATCGWDGLIKYFD